MDQIEPDQTSMTKYIQCVKCNINIDFGYNMLNEMYKQCVKYTSQRAEYKEAHQVELKEQRKEYNYEHKESPNKKKIEHDKIYH